MNLKQLSELLQLSQTTVSRALNGYPEVAEPTRRRVMEAAQRHGYKPNSNARKLATGRAGAIGYVLPVGRNVDLDPHFVEFLSGLGEHALTREVDLSLDTRAARTRKRSLSPHCRQPFCGRDLPVLHAQ